MLMTPSRPNVIARPSAANSSTLASDRPWSRLPPIADEALVALDRVQRRAAPPRARARRARRGVPSAPLAVSRCSSDRKPSLPLLPMTLERREARRRVGALPDRRAPPPAPAPRARRRPSRARSARCSSAAASAEPLFDSSSAAASRTAAVGRPELELRQHRQRDAADLVARPRPPSAAAAPATPPRRSAASRTSRVFASQM